MERVIACSNCIGQFLFHHSLSFDNIEHCSDRPKTDEVTLSLLKRAKENKYSALVVTLDTMLLGWRPHDLDTSYLPFVHGVGTQVGTSDPVFMAEQHMLPIVDENPKFPYDPDELVALALEGDEKTKRNTYLGMQWLAEANSGQFRDWEDVKFLRDNWDGVLILKGILSVAVSTFVCARSLSEADT
jgi:lactate 2-monooxygenase